MSLRVKNVRQCNVLKSHVLCVCVYHRSPLLCFMFPHYLLLSTHCSTCKNIKYITELAPPLTLHTVCSEFTADHDILKMKVLEMKRDMLIAPTQVFSPSAMGASVQIQRLAVSPSLYAKYKELNTHLAWAEIDICLLICRLEGKEVYLPKFQTTPLKAECDCLKIQLVTFLPGVR